MRVCAYTDCDKNEYEGFGLCATHIARLTRLGWKVRPDGTRRRGSVLVGLGGIVKVTNINYNRRMEALMTGEISVEDLDHEELARGMCRNDNGEFPKRMPDMVPADMYKRMTRELFARADEKLRSGLEGAVDGIASLAGNDKVDPALRLKAAQWLFERLRGKVPDIVQVTQEKPFETVLSHIHRGPRPVAETVEDAPTPRHPSPTRSARPRR